MRKREHCMQIVQELGVPVPGPEQMLLALILAASGEIEEAVAAWPALPYDVPDREQRMGLLGVLQILGAAQRMSNGAASEQLLTGWKAQVAALTASV
jgi:hypothetical protein